jgi:hypothetical protein
VQQVCHTYRDSNFHIFFVWLQVWTEAQKGAIPYRPKEAAEHAQRLQTYVQAAAARAGGQMEPGLKKELHEVLEMRL